jgi:pyruvate dehydrogenase E1 component
VPKRLARACNCLAPGTIFREVIAAADLLKNDWGVEADLWGCPSFNELARNGQDTQRWNMLHPLEEPKLSHVEQKLAGAKGPVIASTDYIKLLSEQIRPFVKAPYVTLGTDGFGRSDTREKLRHFFEVDRHWVTLAALKALADNGESNAKWLLLLWSSTTLTRTNPTRCRFNRERQHEPNH